VTELSTRRNSQWTHGELRQDIYHHYFYISL